MIRSVKGIIWRAVCTSICLLFCPFMAQAGTIDMAESGQATCFDASGTEIDCAGTGQDGEKRAGLPWPVSRFSDNADGTLTDNLTGLMWLRDGACMPSKDWLLFLSDLTFSQIDFFACESYSATYEDWRLANINELASLVNDEAPNLADWLNGQGFLNVGILNYFSSTDSTDPTDFSQWGLSILDGVLIQPLKTSPHYLLVRGITTPSTPVWKTGKIVSIIKGDDGHLQRGVEWPVPRFSENTDDTVTDELTGLVWPVDGQTPGPASGPPDCTPNMKKNWQGALDHVSCLNTNAYLGHKDWRLPNRKELLSLIDYAQTNPAVPSGHPFLDLQSDIYWSSATDASDTTKAISVDMSDGRSSSVVKGGTHHLWPVRGGTLGNSDLSALSATGSGEIKIRALDNPDLLVSIHRVFSDTDPALIQTGRPPDLSFPDGLLYFTVTGLNPGDNISVEMIYPTKIPSNPVYYEVTSCCGFVKFENVDFVGGNVATLSVVDGGIGDLDSEEGSIAFLGGPAVGPLDDGSSDGGGSSDDGKSPGGDGSPDDGSPPDGGGSPAGEEISDRVNLEGSPDALDFTVKDECFIATAAFGSYLNPHVKILRDFRDHILIPHPLGRAFVSFYYRNSPPIANFIRQHESLRTVTRWALTPLVYSLAYPGGTFIFISFGIAIVLLRGLKQKEDSKNNDQERSW